MSADFTIKLPFTYPSQVQAEEDSLGDKPLFLSSEDHLLSIFKASPAAKRLWDNTVHERREKLLTPPTIRLLPVTKENSPAWCDPEKGRIFLFKHLPQPKLLQKLLLELCNVSQASEILNLDEQVRAGLIKSFAVYSRKLETIEYRSCRMHDAIIEQSLNDPACPWHPSMRILQYKWSSLKQYLEAQKNSKHTDRYIKRFNDLISDLSTQEDEIDIPIAKPSRTISKTYLLGSVGLTVGLAFVTLALSQRKHKTCVS